MRALVILVDGDNAPAFVSIRREGGYTSIQKAMSSKELRELLLAQALADAESWRRRYKHLEELAPIFAAIEKTMSRPGRHG